MALRGGGFSTLDPYADLNVLLGSAVTARIAGEYQRNDSWIDWVGGNRFSVKPSVLFQLASGPSSSCRDNMTGAAS